MFLLLCYLCCRNDLYPRWQLPRSSSPPLWSMMMRVLVSSAMRTWMIMTPAVSAVVIVSILTYVYIPSLSLPPPPPPPHTHTHTDTYTHRHMSKHTAQYNYSTTKFISSSLVKTLFASTCCILVVILSGCKT